MNKNLLYRSIPKVDVLLEMEIIQLLIEQYGRETVMEAIREEMEVLRAFIGACEEEEKIVRQIQDLPHGFVIEFCLVVIPIIIDLDQS